MSIDNLKNALPEYAKDLKLNLGSIARTTVLKDEQLWGTLLSTAAATKNAVVLKEIVNEMRFDEVTARYGEFGPFYTGLLLDPADALERVGIR